MPAANSTASRLLGLAGLDRERAGEGLVIPGCRSIHTFGMRFPIDVYFLDRSGRVIRSVDRVGWGRILFQSGATSVVEIPSARAGGRDSGPAA